MVIKQICFSFEIMVNIQSFSSKQFHKLLKSKRVICIGAGKNFSRFLEEYRGVEVCVLLDNYTVGTKKNGDESISIRPISYISECGIDKDDAIIVITARRSADLVEQLDGIKEFDGMKCVAPYADDLVLLKNKRNYQREVGSKFQLLFNDGSNTNHVNAGGKAPSDISQIVESVGYQNRIVNSYWDHLEKNDWRFKDRSVSWDKIENKVLQDSVLLLQNPNWNEEEFEFRCERLLKLKEEKNVNIISVVHDVEELRNIDFNEYMKREAEFMLKTSEVLIVHNARMREFYQNKGIAENRLVELKIFDYLSDGDIPSRNFSREVIIAGNLSSKKNPHILQLNEVKGVTFRLFGAEYDCDGEQDNVYYEGAKSADKLANILPDGFGLVWGGDSLESCIGNAGSYLRYNNPHKLSLYLAAGLPVIIWDQAAMAEFVLENEVGVVVSSLYQLKDILEQISNEDYSRLAANARKIGLKLRAGEYTKAALSEAEKRIELMRNRSNG